MLVAVGGSKLVAAPTYNWRMSTTGSNRNDASNNTGSCSVGDRMTSSLHIDYISVPQCGTISVQLRSILPLLPHPAWCGRWQRTSNRTKRLHASTSRTRRMAINTSRIRLSTEPLSGTQYVKRYKTS